MLEIETGNLFRRHFKKLPDEIKHKMARREEVFINNPFDPRLGTHKLHGERKDEWVYEIDYSYRVTFMFLEGNVVFYTDVGTHDQVY
jgi:mRNA-degrading endonuclease YafQ of YafQ-DinJ toxin-antitoxin module